jgi:hypothetical protein
MPTAAAKPPPPPVNQQQHPAPDAATRQMPHVGSKASQVPTGESCDWTGRKKAQKTQKLRDLIYLCAFCDFLRPNNSPLNSFPFFWRVATSA